MHVLHILDSSKASIIHYSNALPFKAEHTQPINWTRDDLNFPNCYSAKSSFGSVKGKTSKMAN